ncbi:MAG: hypothetical protein F4018_08340 [Acidobacteria bacterium]|nr:hypothetical protein [Acidobacteriota bacterium]MYK88338.1 hypothetical protein [Acidobacteriota bacterium]
MGTGTRHDARRVAIEKLATKADLTAVATGLCADMSVMETRLTWRLVGARAAVGAILRFIG